MDLKITKNKETLETVVANETSGEAWNVAKAWALKELTKKLEVKGFRKGNVPLEIAKKHISPVELLQKAGDKIIAECYDEMIKQGVNPVFQPELNVTDISEEKIAFEFKVVSAPTITIGDYSHIEVSKKKITVKAEEVTKSLNDLLNKNAELEVCDEKYKAKLGDTVIIDFEGFVDGVAFEGGKGENHELELGSHQFIDNFEDQLVSHKKGETVEVEVNFPENYVPELAGKHAKFVVKINDIKHKVIPEANDDFAKECDIEGVETLDQLKEHLKENIKKEKEEAETQRRVEEMMGQIVTNSTFEIHSKLIEEEANYILKDFEQRLQYQGLDMATYLTMSKQSEDDVKAKAREEAIKAYQHMLMLQEIAKKEKITLTQEEIDAKLTELGAAYGMDLETVKKQLGERVNEFVARERENKVVEFLKNANKI